jgi:hypothetical protein
MSPPWKLSGNAPHPQPLRLILSLRYPLQLDLRQRQGKVRAERLQPNGPRLLPTLCRQLQKLAA